MSQKLKRRHLIFSKFKAEDPTKSPKYESLVSMISDLEFSCDERI